MIGNNDNNGNSVNDATYSGVVTRLLAPGERAMATAEIQTPLLIESSKSRHPGFLSEFLAAHSEAITADIARHGAVLLRGFDVDSVQEFERQILSIRGMRGIDEVFMSEEGRTVVEGTRFVLHTSTLYKTGGSFRPVGGFHTENYFVPDVPRYISFCCLQPSVLGGETGLVNVAGLYADLPRALVEKLEQQAFLVAEIALDKVAQRYGLLPGQVEDLCHGAGLTVTERDGIKRVAIFKPSVVIHPVTHEPTLVLNTTPLNGVGLAPALVKAFMADYGGAAWFMHRLGWQRQWVGLVASALEEPRMAWKVLQHLLYGRRRAATAARPMSVSPELRIGQVFSGQETALLARCMRARFSSFRWRRGDILILDNLKMAHTGMPGFGARDLKAMICNPLPVPVTAGPGVYAPAAQATCETLGAQLVRMRKTGQSASTAAQSPVETA